MKYFFILKKIIYRINLNLIKMIMILLLQMLQPQITNCYNRLSSR